jgi:lipoprotein-releasing system ATP-binding protein
VTQGTAIGLIGTLAGVALGVLIATNLETLVHGLERLLEHAVPRREAVLHERPAGPRRVGRRHQDQRDRLRPVLPVDPVSRVARGPHPAGRGAAPRLKETNALNSAATVLECTGLTKSFMQGDVQVDVLKGVEFSVAAGDRVAIVGASGSGKTTLLQLLGGLDLPTSGDVLIAGQRVSALSDAARGTLRNHSLGFVYQFHHLLPEFSAVENVAMPLLDPARVGPRRNRGGLRGCWRGWGWARACITVPGQLSGGERQRAAVARALVTKPQVVLADEPTGNLDGANATQVFELMLELNRESGTALVIVTHAPELAARMQKVYRLDGGRLVQA